MATAAARDAVFDALADPTRRQVLSLVGERGEATASGIASELPVSRQAVQKHLVSLTEAGLVASRRDGREVLYRVTPAPMSDAVSWIAAVGAQWDTRLAALARHLSR